MITDLKYALRMLIKAPAFSIIAILTLALGIGANSAIFSVVDTVLLRPLNFKNPEQIVMIWGTHPQEPGKDVDSYPDYLDYRAQSQSFAAMTAFTRSGSVLTGNGEARVLKGLAVTSDIFDVLGAHPVLGRPYTREEEKEGASPVVVLAHSFWKGNFNGDPKVVGQQINLSGKSYTILGVMPAGWNFPVEDAQRDYLTPLAPFIQKQATQR
ncbi:MAG TPA: ABC transporter permease, partial [Chthoniobacterales bacterium]|nr:ABC transporter permease [Chthoniobacterales bacterium]